MSKIRALLNAIALINFSIILLATINGLLFLLYYRIANDVAGLQIASRFAEASFLLLLFWLTIVLTNREYKIESVSEAMLVVALTWITVPLSSAVIYIASLGLDPIDAFFESLSGFSGTGLSILSNLEAIPYVIHIWRGLTQWLGELGTVVIAGVILPYVHPSLIKVYSLERGPRLMPTIRDSMRALFGIYSIYTLIGVVLLLIAGMNVLDAIMHSMTAIATGGMSSKTMSIGYWVLNGMYATIPATIVVMVLGAQNFKDLNNLLKLHIRDFINSPEVRGFFAILVTLLIPTILSAEIYKIDLVEATYHLISGYTTTGFQITPSLYSYPDVLKFIITIAMIIGGATFSTAGGIKTRRILIGVKTIAWDIQRSVLPKGSVIVKRLGREVLDEDSIESTQSYIILYMITLLVLSVAAHIVLKVYGFTQFTYIDTLFEVSSALSCVGLSVGITSATAPLAVKVLLMLAMYLGRLEFLPVYLLIGYYYIEKRLPG